MSYVELTPRGKKACRELAAILSADGERWMSQKESASIAIEEMLSRVKEERSNGSRRKR